MSPFCLVFHLLFLLLAQATPKRTTNAAAASAQSVDVEGDGGYRNSDGQPDGQKKSHFFFVDRSNGTNTKNGRVEYLLNEGEDVVKIVATRSKRRPQYSRRGHNRSRRQAQQRDDEECDDGGWIVSFATNQGRLIDVASTLLAAAGTSVEGTIAWEGSFVAPSRGGGTVVGNVRGVRRARCPVFHNVTSGTCHRWGYHTIYSDNMCLRAAERLGYPVTPRPEWGPNGGYRDVVDGCSIRRGNQVFVNPMGTCVAGSKTPHWVPGLNGAADCQCSKFQPCLCVDPVHASSFSEFVFSRMDAEEGGAPARDSF